MKNILIMTVALFMLAASVASRADQENANSLIGLWEGVDSLDGSHLILSITDNGEGTVKLLMYDTYWTLCNGGRGIEQSTGEISAEGVLTTEDFPITCFETGDTKSVPATFTRNSDGTLTMLSAGLFPSITFHRTGK